MSTKSLFRIGGWSALLIIMVMVSGLVAIAVAPTSGIVEASGIVGEFLGAPVLYALFILHRPESAALSLAGLVLWVPGAILGIVGVLNRDDAFLSAMSSLANSPTFLILGLLAYRSSKMPRGLAWVNWLAGGCLLLGAGAWLLGSAVLDMLASLFVIAYPVWCVWLWRLFASGKLDPQASSSPGDDPAFTHSPSAPRG